jgi:release factor glutamine methyltransferase
MLHALLRQARGRLMEAGIPPAEAALDAALLAGLALACDRATVIAMSNQPPPEGFDSRYAPLIARRARREPIAYIRGTQEFWGREFAVRPGVLIPRPETEFIIEEALAWNQTRVDSSLALRVLDIGTGSGCLAITLALEIPAARVAGTDISPQALEVARANQQRLAADVTWHEGSYLADAAVPVDLMVANPPYVSAHEYQTLQPEVRDYEPVAALLSGDDGLEAIRSVVRAAAIALHPGGRLLMEVGHGQAAAVQQIIEGTGELRYCGTRRDLQGIPRVAIATNEGRVPQTPLTPL